MNEFLNSLAPINPAGNKRSSYNLQQFKEFVESYDVNSVYTGIEQYDDYLDLFFRTFPYAVTERDMQVIASMLSWLGTNVGRHFVTEAHKLAKQVNSLDMGFVYAWAKENCRIAWLNNGFTIIEYLLTPGHLHSPEHGLLCGANKYVTVRDMETCNYLVRWFASNDGQAYLNRINDTAYSRHTTPTHNFDPGTFVFIKDKDYREIFVVTNVYETHIEIKTGKRGYPVPSECWGFSVQPSNLRRADPDEVKALARLND